MPKFGQHLAEVNESYLQHCAHALSFSLTLMLAAFVCLVHALIPCLFEKTGSTLVTGLYERMVAKRQSLSDRQQCDDAQHRLNRNSCQAS